MATNLPTIISALKTVLTEDLHLNFVADQIDERMLLMDGGLNLDSIVIVDLIGAVESRFNFQFEDDDLRTATFENLQTLAEVVSRRTSGGR